MDFTRFFFGISRGDLFLRFLLGYILIVLFVEVTDLLLFNVPVVLNMGYGVAGLHWNNVELSFSNLAYPFLPYAYLFLVFSGIVAFVVKALPTDWSFKIKGRHFETFRGRLSGSFESSSNGGFDFLRGRFVLVAAVFVGATISCLFVIFTVLPWSNPTHMLVSADSPSYYQFIVYMKSVNINSALSFAFANDRALFLVLGYALSFVASLLVVIQFVAALLIVMLGIVSLYILRLFCSFRVVWVLGVLLVPFSFQSLGLIYSGYFANMLALILVFIYVILFFKILKSWSSLVFFGLLVVSVLILLSHSWTWFIFALSLVAFLFLEWRLALRDKSLWSRFKEKFVLIIATVVVGFSVYLVRIILSSTSDSVVETVRSGLSFPNWVFLFSSIQKNVNFALGGVFANGLFLFLSVVGFFFLLRLKSEVPNFLVSWIFVACTFILFAAQDFVFIRLSFLMPWIILSVLGYFLFCNLHFITLMVRKAQRFVL